MMTYTKVMFVTLPKARIEISSTCLGRNCKTSQTEESALRNDMELFTRGTHVLPFVRVGNCECG